MEPKFEVVIDFEESSREWMKNKTKLSNGVYRYIDERTHLLFITHQLSCYGNEIFNSGSMQDHRPAFL